MANSLMVLATRIVEVLFFTGLIGTYIVLRFGAQRSESELHDEVRQIARPIDLLRSTADEGDLHDVIAPA